MSWCWSCTPSRLRSPDTTTCSSLSAMASLPACTAARISAAMSLLSASTSVLRRSRTSSIDKPA